MIVINDLKIISKIPTAEEFIYIRKETGWDTYDVKAAEISLKNSLFSICAYYNEKLIGYGRIVGDGGMYFYIQNLIVLPEFQRKGIGKLIMTELMNYIDNNCSKGSFIGLMASRGKENFYKKFNFIIRPKGKYGSGMFMLRH
ncbi:GNAT family N-acetyltransferase [Clostridium tyrobutyricum]|uniref:GNAT family N-acetyltransferase n=1 Tax=Clostridium tyrobutyricum TaxID=1519 RepID=UPI001C3846FD|nr:GNAT family N-acetyltransferase [Clostridium tyrobutyricum]MBV4432486.1 GNAT family N-acetyltransferase [Clostridium tyrobutyricum]